MPNATTDEEGLGPVQCGRQRYHQKDYAGALTAFTEAVNMSTGNLLLTALDHRAAAYEKLNQVQPALRDAKRMIDLKPEVSKGYLRCGKILLLKGESGLALKIYERGLNRVKIGTDDERALLQSIYNKTRRAEDPGRNLDPLEFLSLELVEMVFRHLLMRDRVICLAVSKAWKRLLESSHNLWDTLDTTYARKSMSQTSLKSHLRRSNYTLDHAIITMRADFDSQKMIFLTKHCKMLKHLQIHGDGIIGNSLASSLPYASHLETICVRDARMTEPVIRDVLQACRGTVVQAEFLNIGGRMLVSDEKWPNLSALQSLRLVVRSTILKLNLLELIEATPNLQALTLVSWHLTPLTDISLLSKLQELDLSETLFEHLPKLPRTLRRLSLRNAGNLIFMNLEIQEGNMLPLLEYFDCSGTQVCGKYITAVTRESIKQGNLKVLFVGGRPIDTSAIPEEEYPSSESLEQLSLAQLDISDDFVMRVVDLYPNLRKLDVQRTKITGVAVKHFVRKGITFIKLNECDGVGSDAVDWARGQGVEVRFSLIRARERRGAQNISFAGIC